MTSLLAFLLVQSANFDTAFFFIRLSANLALYLVCIAMTQVRPWGGYAILDRPLNAPKSE